MITTIYSRQQGKNKNPSRLGKLETASQSDSVIEGDDAGKIKEELKKIPGVNNVDTNYTYFFGMCIPLGWEIKGEYDPNKLYQVVCNAGYSILKTKIQR
jgi:hypothetical protein